MEAIAPSRHQAAEAVVREPPTETAPPPPQATLDPSDAAVSEPAAAEAPPAAEEEHSGPAAPEARAAEVPSQAPGAEPRCAGDEADGEADATGARQQPVAELLQPIVVGRDAAAGAPKPIADAPPAVAEQTQRPSAAAARPAASAPQVEPVPAPASQAVDQQPAASGAVDMAAPVQVVGTLVARQGSGDAQLRSESSAEYETTASAAVVGGVMGACVAGPLGAIVMGVVCARSWKNDTRLGKFSHGAAQVGLSARDKVRAWPFCGCRRRALEIDQTYQFSDGAILFTRRTVDALESALQSARAGPADSNAPLGETVEQLQYLEEGGPSAAGDTRANNSLSRALVPGDSELARAAPAQ